MVRGKRSPVIRTPSGSARPAGANTARGSAQDDYLYLHGAEGDAVHGKGGDGWLFGGRGDYILEEGDGCDVLTGGGGNDVLSGGAGHDVFVLRVAHGDCDFALHGNSVTITHARGDRSEGTDHAKSRRCDFRI